MTLAFRHLLDIESLETRDIIQFLDTAEVFFDVSRRKIRKVPTGNKMGMQNVPNDPVTIQKAECVGAPDAKSNAKADAKQESKKHQEPSQPGLL